MDKCFKKFIKIMKNLLFIRCPICDGIMKQDDIYVGKEFMKEVWTCQKCGDKFI